MKNFYIDHQTKEDLQLFGRERSIFGCLNFTITNGGDKALKELLSEPLADMKVLNQRRDIISFLMNHVDHMAFDKTSVDFMDYYLHKDDRPDSFSVSKAVKNLVWHYFFPSVRYYKKRRGIHETLETLAFIHQFCGEFAHDDAPPLISGLQSAMSKFVNQPALARIITGGSKWLNRYAIEKADFLLRKKWREETLAILEDIYILDAYYSVAKASKSRGFTFPVYLEGDSSRINITGLFHPFIEQPVLNDLSINNEKNVHFVTGANMSGKSTFMKSFGVAVYLAHVGFPVPAARMETTVLDGLITAINLPDNLSEGYSHFYNEAKRVKLVAEKVNGTARMLVMFDELFRGTNVTDAFEASLRIIRAFSNIKQGFFILSTHIVEVAKVLKENEDIVFKHFQTDMRSGIPIFDYRLLDGISDDRIGLWILQNEGIFDLLEKSDDVL